MAETTTVLPAELPIHEQPWKDPLTFPPTDLPADDGERMESSWHASSGPLLKASYIAARDGAMTDFYVGVNMFVYYSWQQVRNKEYKGPDLYIAKGVDGTRRRPYWAIWEEDGRYPDVIMEFLSPTTEREDLGNKMRIYAQTFRTPEYFCVAPEVERLLGWHLANGHYEPIVPDERGWLWSNQLDLWLGPWHGTYLGEEATWLRFYHPDGALVLLPEEAERERADAATQQAEAERERAEAERERAEEALQQVEAERRRADDLAARLAELEAEMQRLRGS